MNVSCFGGQAPTRGSNVSGVAGARGEGVLFSSLLASADSGARPTPAQCNARKEELLRNMQQVTQDFLSRGLALEPGSEEAQAMAEALEVIQLMIDAYVRDCVTNESEKARWQGTRDTLEQKKKHLRGEGNTPPSFWLEPGRNTGSSAPVPPVWGPLRDWTPPGLSPI